MILIFWFVSNTTHPVEKRGFYTRNDAFHLILKSDFDFKQQKKRSQTTLSTRARHFPITCKKTVWLYLKSVARKVVLRFWQIDYLKKVAFFRYFFEGTDAFPLCEKFQKMRKYRQQKRQIITFQTSTERQNQYQENQNDLTDFECSSCLLLWIANIKMIFAEETKSCICLFINIWSIYSRNSDK